MNAKITKIDYIYDCLIRVANAKNIDVYNNFAGEKSILWTLRNRKILLINEKEDKSTQLMILCRILRDVNLNDIYLTPNIRELIENSNINTKKKTTIKCKICRKNITKSSNKLLKVCENCFKYQIKFGLSFENCNKKNTCKECLNCPVFEECPVVLNRLYPNYKELQNAGMINNKVFERINITEKNIIYKNITSHHSKFNTKDRRH